jgi:multifunctional methyltransferase subunit TRM112
LDVTLPEVKPEEPLEEELLHKLHSVLFEHYLKSGKMTCPGCGHLFPIKDGIPNMLLVEDEV